MFPSSIVIKVLVGLTSTGAFAAAAVFGTMQLVAPTTSTPKPIMSVVVHKKDAIPNNQTLTLSGKESNYRCKYQSTTLPCSLIPLQLSDSKTWMNIEEIKSASSTDNPPSITSADKKFFFKIEVDESFFNTLKENIATPKVISIVEWASNSEGAALFTADMLFAIGQDQTIFFDKSTFVVKSATISHGGTPDASQSSLCSFSDTDTAEGAPIPCSLSELGSSLESTADFGTAATTSAITADKTYLVNFTESSHTKGLAQATRDTKKLLFLKPTTTSGQTTNQLIAKFENANVEPAIVVNEGAKKYAFILN